MKTYLIKNAQLVNEGRIFRSDVYVQDGRISQVAENITLTADETIDASGKYLLPGVIDDQVHFREPGLTHKGDIFTESRAAVAGGVTSFMEMPNTVPNTITQELLAQKYEIGANTSLANYSFFMGATNDNLEEVLKTDPQNVCGIKIFMGSSTGNMLVDNQAVLEKIFKEAPMLVAVHCEDEATIRANQQKYDEQYGENIPMRCHPEIRSAEACYKSSSMAVELAQKHNTRLHILHISTADELELFRNNIPLAEKRITAEVCVHHLYFDKDDYETLGSGIKCNPAIKEKSHKAALLPALLNDKLDIIATDHAPHTWEEKQNLYKKAPSGLPLVQHSLALMLDFYNRGEISLEKIVEKMSHAPAICFDVAERGYIREGYWADLVLVDLNQEQTVAKENILYKCGWSPLEGKTFTGVITHTFVSGHLAYAEGRFDEGKMGERLLFTR
ncbi:dihydroorotase [Adhaeribacter rhizoryzae]|uniref:Dihydroorotase n=1 Tax=Adhaeribacter rhizoryzae TaxID=2607907 RepID=A0A5M6D771_9BACT|nr:dihydroorotase [Adhaeribacter rhizoryzae]KAA5543347.1 dihydroorotase [Adhaeribacter rhizoryzae]